ncbi:hypothetical protein BH23CHL2_BH23CHL2_27020 [soil metagenome]
MTEYEALLRVTLAAVLGGAIGIERELAEKQAGLRTHALVALGAALFTVIGIRLVDMSYVSEGIIALDPSRVIAGIVGGIGFLGGAVVFRGKDRAQGLTTAAGIWAVTGIGVATGLGSYLLAAGVALVVLTILYILKLIERLMGTS